MNPTELTDQQCLSLLILVSVVMVRSEMLQRRSSGYSNGHETTALTACVSSFVYWFVPFMFASLLPHWLAAPLAVARSLAVLSALRAPRC